MSLMKLAPESVRLRRMARAYAAGEISEDEYRAARREVIDNFAAGVPLDDDTRPRRGDERTLRSVGAAGIVESSAASRAAAGSAARRWLWVVLLALLLSAALLALPDAQAAAGILQVPPLRERSPDPASSPRGEVQQVRVRWSGGFEQDLPADLLDDLQGRAEQSLAVLRAGNAPGAHGFTATELNEVARLLSVLGVHQDADGLDAADARDLTALIREQKSRRGVSVAQLEEVAANVQVLLRERGYFLAAAYVPAQRVERGVAWIEVLPGRLGDIVVEGGDPQPATGLFAPLLGEPLTMAVVSSRLQALNTLPGVAAQASFAPGAAVGESLLRLDLLEQRDWLAGLTLDNHGDDATGRQRLGLTAAWLNPRRIGDRLSAGALQSVNPANQTYGYLDYDTPLTGSYRLAVRVGNNDFSVDGAPRLDGDGTFVDVSARRTLAYSRTRGVAVTFAGARQALDWQDGVQQTVILGSAGLAGHRVFDAPRVALDAALSLSAGRVGADRFAGQDAGFWLLELESEAWLPVALPLLDGEQKLVARLAAQWSNSLLPPTRRLALGGAGGARGFERGIFLADRGVRLGLEARFPVTLGELVAFSDMAYGRAESVGTSAWARLSDVGLGWEAPLTGSLTSRVSWALPLTTRGTGGLDDDGARLYWSLRYEH